MLRHVLGFKWRKGDVAAFSGERGSYWRSRVIVRRLGFKSENGVHYLANRRTGFKCGDLRIIGAKENFGVQMQRSEDRLRREKTGVQEKHKRGVDNPERMCGVRTMVIPELPFILVSRSTFRVCFFAEFSPFQTDFCFKIVFLCRF